MTPDDLWWKYIGTLGDSDRHELFVEYYRSCQHVSDIRSGDVVEYALFVRTGQVAEMPDVTAWE